MYVVSKDSFYLEQQYKEKNSEIIYILLKKFIKILPVKPIQITVKKEFGKLPGFNVQMLLRDMQDDSELVDNNIAIASKNYSTLTSLEDTMKKVQSRMYKSVGSRLVDMFSSFGGSSRGLKTMFESI